MAARLLTPILPGDEPELWGEPYPDRPGLTLWSLEPGSTCPTTFSLGRPGNPKAEALERLCRVPEDQPELALEVIERMLDVCPVTVEALRALRERFPDAGLFFCKRALERAEGNIDEAARFLAEDAPS